MKTLLILASFIFLLVGCNGYSSNDKEVSYTNNNKGSFGGKRVIKDADPKTFELLSDPSYGKDKSYVFHKGIKIKGADPKTFKLLKHGYAVDKNRGYYTNDSIPNSTSVGFRVLDKEYAIDSKDAYFMRTPLNVKSVANFKLLSIKRLNGRWATDGNYYWYNKHKTPSEDYQNVEIINTDYAFSKDTETVYYSGRNIKFNENGERILDTIDMETFELLNSIECKDKFGPINVFRGRVKD